MRPHLLFTTLSFTHTHLKSSRHFIVRALSSLRRDDGTVILSPDDPSKHSASVILCHGLGDTADGWVDPARYLANKLPHVKFILPTAPTQPVTLNMGFAMPSWYDIVGLDSRSNEICEGLDDSMNTVLDLIDEEVANSVDYSRIVLAGFSQGGALALYTGMTCGRREEKVGLGLAGIVVMSGYLPRASQFQIANGSESTPILHCHGKDDPVVVVDAVELSKKRVIESGGSNDLYQTKIYPGLEHSVSMEELEDVSAFLERVIPAESKSDEL